MNKHPSPFEIAHLSGKRYIPNLIEMYVVDWQARGKFKLPGLLASAGFLVTEAAEALEAVLRQDPSYTRNNERESDLGAELADVVFMACITAKVAGVDLVQAVEVKLEAMDEMRLDDRGEA